MIYNSKYINLELTQVAKSSNSGTLAIRISRNNPYYFNREGIQVIVEETVDGENYTLMDHIYTWYTAYDPKTQDMKSAIPYDGDLVTPPPTIEADNFYIDNLDFSISMIIADTVRRVGKKQIKVSLLENNTGNEIIVEGTIQLETLEIPEPVIHSVDIKAEDGELVVNVDGVNPSGTYTLEVLNNLEGMLGYGTNSNVTYRSTIISSWYKQEVTYTVRWMLDGEVVKEERKTFRVPSLDLGFHAKYGGEIRKVKAIYIKQDGQFKSISAGYFKNAGEFITQE